MDRRNIITTRPVHGRLLLLVQLISICCIAAGNPVSAHNDIIVSSGSTKSHHDNNRPYPSAAGSLDHVFPIRDRALALIDDELPPLFPFRWRGYLGFSVAIVGLVLAGGGGIGGGGILVPTYILLLDLPVKRAISLASITVLGGAIANNLLNARKRHPNNPNRSVIDWELILQFEPMTIAGTVLGAFLNKILPALLLVILMVILLSVTAYKTFAKANELNKKENEAECRGASEGTLDETKPLIEDSKTLDIEQQETQSDLAKGSANHAVAVRAATKLTVLFGVITTLNLFAGAPGEQNSGPIGLSNCGPACFWSVEAIILVFILAFAFWQRHDLLQRIKAGNLVDSDIVWTEENTLVYPLYSVGAGLIAGLFGVGGGIIKGSLMLALGVHPAVAAASSACMILFTSSTATLSFVAFGLLQPDYAIFCLLVGFVSTVVGQLGMSVLLKRYQRNSYIAYCIGLVVAISAVAMVIESVVALTE
ncbi:sulfite exporter TauE/SafE [Nitzschia inconspicua]|uniref:Sulfite exporter TauE/SafE n=1 Tax=Nitzschia inconspicua TaxID=303405 RepID=A0A9K3LSF1_9STRA|nr:sulfite exporter TauE/SafE [Nitzschia inconspicua]